MKWAQIIPSLSIYVVCKEYLRIFVSLCSPGTRRRTRDRNSTPQNESAPEPRAFQPPHLMNSRQIHPASLHPHLHGGPQQVMFDMEQVRIVYFREIGEGGGGEGPVLR